MINGFNVNRNDLDTMLVPRSYFNQGTLWVWGYNYYFGLGNTTNVSVSSPTQTIASGLNWKQVVNANSFGAGIKTDGTLWTWGRNNTGQLGDNSTIAKSSPVQIVGGGTTWKQISAGWNQQQSAVTSNGACLAIKTDGTLWAWGRNSYGQLGDNTIISKSSPVQTVAAGFNWKQVSIQLGHAVAVKTDGTLWTWGLGTSGQLGNNLLSNVSSPIQTGQGGTSWNSVSAGSYSSSAIKTDGTLWTWGKNNYGQLGNESTSNVSSPIQTVASGTNWKQVSMAGPGFGGSAGPAMTAAIKTDGTLWVWGNNNYGQLGDNTTISKSSPIQTISAGTNWKQVSAGYLFTAAIKIDGTLWTWGNNGTPTLGATGQLGDNTTIAKSSPVQTVASGTNWSQCSAGYGLAAATVYIYN
jgi:alpha-tubulin suppressor-like RCC1 family protein